MKQTLTQEDLNNIEIYKKSGRLVFIKPIKKRISLNGGMGLNYENALNQIKECINRESLK
jgi:hypothetical protein